MTEAAVDREAIVNLSERRGVDPALFRESLGAHAAGVVVVTGASADGPVGLTATSFSSVSLDPPLVSFYAAHSSTTWPHLRGCDRFAVNVLAEGQEDVAARFARRGEDRFAGTDWRPGHRGVPLLAGAAVRLVCRPYDTIDIGDHVLVVGLVTEAVARDRPPLLYHRGRFGRLAP